MWGSAPFLCRVDSGLFLTYFEGDASVQQQLLWLREDGSLRHQQAESTFTIRYAYTLNNQCKLIGVESIGTEEWNWCGITARTYADDGSLVALDTLYSDTLFGGAVLANYYFTERNGVLWAALMTVETVSGANHYSLGRLRCESGVVRVGDFWPIQSILAGVYIFNLSIVPASEGNAVVTFGINHNNLWTLRYYGLDTDGQPFGPYHEYALQNSQALTGLNTAVYEGTVYGSFTANNLSFPHGAGAFLIGFPAEEILSAAEPGMVTPNAFALQAFPNPFNGSTRLHFSLKREAYASLDLFDITGRRIDAIASDRFAAGEHEIMYHAASLPSGVYFLRMYSERHTAASKLLLIK